MFIKQCVATQNIATDAYDFVGSKFRNEDGEVASYMIVLAMLVAVGGYAATQLDTPLRGKVDAVVTSLN